MDKFSLLLSVVALGLAGFVMLQDRSGDPATGPDTTDDTVLMDRLARIESSLEALAAGRGGLLHGAPHAGTEPGLSGNPSATSAEAAPAWAARLEKNLAETNERLAKVEATGASHPAGFKVGDGTLFSPRGGPKRFLHNSDAAARALELDDRQKQDLARVVDNTQERLKELYETPNEDGKTLSEINTLDMGMSELAEGEVPDLDMGKLMSHMANIEKFKKGTVPGTRESYRDAEKRIRNEGKTEARGLLNEDQAKKWDESHTDPMFRSPGSGTAVMTTTVSGGPISIGGVMGGDRDK